MIRGNTRQRRKDHLLANGLDVRTSRVESSDKIKLGGSVIDGYCKIVVDIENGIVGDIC